MQTKHCVFCGIDQCEGERIIGSGELFISFVSNPWFRAGQCLVIPRRHVSTLDELTPQEGGAIMTELGRLSNLLDEGFGTGIMQKYQPLQAENGIKVNHLHFHVFPRKQQEESLFPVPQPNNFEGFVAAPEPDLRHLIKKVKG